MDEMVTAGASGEVADLCATGPRGVEVDLAHARLRLLPERAVWWHAERTLLIADAHLGKPASFRAGGTPVPEDATRADLARLGALIDAFGARRVVVLGDLAHDRAAWDRATMESVSSWRARHGSVEVVLVRGNHDRRASDPPAELAIACVDPGWVLGGIAMHHEPCEAGEADAPRAHEARPVLAGHLHPGVRLRDARGRALRAPCFWERSRQMVLPAFGSFTGLWMIAPRAGDRVHAVGPGVVVALGGASARVRS